MGTKESYYTLVQQNRRLAADPQVTKCTCPNTLCDWHGKCTECVALHRHHGDHVPACLQPMLEEKLAGVAGIAELELVPKERTPIEYRLYAKSRDRQGKKEGA